MAETIFQISPDKHLVKQIDNYILDRAGTILNNVLNRANIEDTTELMDIEETCKFLKDCSLGTLNKYSKLGLKKHKNGQKVYYLRSEVLDFIAKLPPE